MYAPSPGDVDTVSHPSQLDPRRRRYYLAPIFLLAACEAPGTTAPRTAHQARGEQVTLSRARGELPPTRLVASPEEARASVQKPVEARPRAKPDPGSRKADLEAAPSPCSTGPAPAFDEPGGPRASFSLHGYVGYDLGIERTLAGATNVHCLRLGWPAGDVNNDGAPSRVARGIGPSWFRAIENTLARVPWHHVKTLERVIIDNRPKEHGIAPYDRKSADDARDGRTLWLHEHLFRDPNHWTQGNHGSYFSYHVNEDGVRFAELPDDHDAFSPVLLHELGHLVMYNVVNGGSAMPNTPACALTCGDRNDCAELSQSEREAECISPYCMPFRYPAGTENFAEQYRFHYQSAHTRELLSRHGAGCTNLLLDQDHVGAEVHPPPWELGLPESSYRPSLWKSCLGRACKGY